eukprot:5320339-Lingulodinium_polyedra.AAC.1
MCIRDSLCGWLLYRVFLKSRITQQLEFAKQSPGMRAEAIRVSLESASLGSVEHASLVFARTMEDDAKPILE